MRGGKIWICIALLGAAAVWYVDSQRQLAPTTASTASQADSTARSSTNRPALPDFLPPEARDTLSRIARGGPFRHPQDGQVFGNYEHHLPQEPRGYYREYTVETPGLNYRGARRIIAGGDPPSVYYYTDDHYDTFREFRAPSQ